MNASSDFSGYSTVLFIDSMVALEGKPLASLPWKEIDPAGPILILIVPQVMSEIDKRKRDGRLGKRAREFNRLVAPAAESGGTTRVSAGILVVDIGFAVCDRINWDNLDDLDPEEGDARVVAQILHARGIINDRKLLLSHDNNPIAMAARHDLKRRKLPDHWLREPEPSPNDKEIARLKNRVRELEAKEPELQFGIEFSVKQPVVVYRVRQLALEEQDWVVHNTLLHHDPELNKRTMMTEGDADLADRREKYRDEIVPRHAARLHHYLETGYSQIPFTFTLTNDGHIQAEHIVVTLRAMSGSLSRKYRAFARFGPPPPQSHRFDFPSLENIERPWLKGPIGRHEMEFGSDSGEAISIQCVDFRHGASWSFVGVATIDISDSGPFCIEVCVTASNQTGVIRSSFPLQFQVDEVDVQDLFDLEACAHRIDAPIFPRLRAAMEAEDLGWIEIMDEYKP
jgi:hypothetical protein